MDFKALKQKALDLKNKAVEMTDKGMEKVAKKVGESSLVLKTTAELDVFIQKSENKTFVNSEGETKIFTKRVFVILGDSKHEFFKEFLLSIPVLLTKSFSQSISLKMVDTSNEQVDIKKYDLKEFPCMIVFENKELYKVISGEENIKKVVKSFSLDINKTIEEL